MAFVPGIDVSHHQAGVDWTAVAGAGIRYAFIKASEGTAAAKSAHDARFGENWPAAQAAGLAVGAYHFCRPSGPAGDAAAEVDNFAAVVEGAGGWGQLPPVADVEATKLDPGQTAAWTLEFCGLLEQRSGRTPIVYTGLSMVPSKMAADPGLARFPLWMARYTAGDAVDPDPTQIKPPGTVAPWPAFSIWQYTSTGRVPGVGGNVDRNVAEEAVLAGLLAGGPQTARGGGSSGGGGAGTPAAATLAISATVPVLQEGDGANGRAIGHVWALQGLLKGSVEPDMKLDGAFGSATVRAVQSHQGRHGLPATGVVDAATWQTLLSGG